jgi:hypothetical protein
VGWVSAVIVDLLYLELQCDVPGGDRHAQLDVLVLFLGDLAGEHVAHRCGGLATGAGPADALPTAERRLQAGGLACSSSVPAAIDARASLRRKRRVPSAASPLTVNRAGVNVSDRSCSG